MKKILFIFSISTFFLSTSIGIAQSGVVNKMIEPFFGFGWDIDNSSTAQSLPNDRFGETLINGDFNGDGFPDLAIGAPNRDIFAADVGLVIVLYGNQLGLTNVNSSIITTSTQIEADSEFFGKSLASGDFNNDGYDDLAIGAPGKHFTNPISMVEFENTGAIYIHYGSASGVTATGQFIDADENDELTSDRQEFAEFGHALTSGDYDGDGFDDLVVSAPGQSILVDQPFGDPETNAGIIFIYYGGQINSANMGLNSEIRDTLFQSSPNVQGTSESNDLFGYSLATGDFNNNGFDDLAIGVPFEGIEPIPVAGLVQVFYGNNLGLINDDQIYQQDDMIGAATEAGDLFGLALAVGDINGDSIDDLLIGAPLEDIANITDAGVAHYLPGTSIGLDPANSVTFSQETPGIFGVAETDDRFGLSLLATDLNADGFDEVIVGVPFEENNGVDSGFIHTIPGLNTGLDFAESSFIAGENANDNFGHSFATSENYVGPSLIISMPGSESFDNDLDSGAIIESFYLNPDIIHKDGFDFNFSKDL